MSLTRRSSLSFGFFWSSGATLLATLCGASGARAESLDSMKPRETSLAPDAARVPSAAEAPPDDATRLRVIETAPMQPGVGMMLVHVSAGSHSFSVFAGKGKRPIADCSEACEFWVWPGKYRAVVRHGNGPEDDAELALRVQGRGNYSFVPANGGLQNTGLVLGASGPVIGFVGLVLVAVGLLATCNDPSPGQTCRKPTSFYLGLGALAAGSAMTTAGWVLYARHRAHFELSDSPLTTRRAELGVFTISHSGLGLGAKFAF